MSIQLNTIIAQNEEPNLNEMFFQEVPFIYIIDVLHVLHNKVSQRRDMRLIKHLESEIVNRILVETNQKKRISETTLNDISQSNADMRLDDITFDSLNESSDQYVSYYTKNINDI